MRGCRDASPLCPGAVKTSLLTPPPLRLTAKCQNPKAERDHNKLITNRKWLHYGLKDRREWSLVTALTQIHIPAGFRERQVSPLFPSRCPRPGALLRVSGVSDEGCSDVDL